MKLTTFITLAFCTVMPSSVLAQSQPVVVELFTSQGCSSCPPADALLHRLARREDVIPLALHVDYWDYIGWKDQFADPAHTRRQKDYAAIAGRRMIYTPQMVINGQEDLVGVKPMELADLINHHKAANPVATLHTQRVGNDLTVTVAPVSEAVSGPLDVVLVHYTPKRAVKITRGENAGRDIEYANVVDSWTVLGQWGGKQTVELRASIQGSLPAVVLIQYPGPGKIVAAARAE